MRLLTQNQARELDKLSTSDYNISDDSLMDMAGKKTADFIHSKFKEIGTQTIAIVCGKGNNGGDGFATALHLDQLNYRVVIFSLFDSQFISKSNKSFHDRCLKKEINVCYGFDLPSKDTHFDIVVDAILGIGFSGELNNQLIQWVEWINNNKTVISIDVPTGLNSDTGTIANQIIKANYTVTMGKAKIGMVMQPGKSFCGENQPVDIGFPNIIDKLSGRKWYQVTDKYIQDTVKPLNSDTHKYQQGKVLILAGSVGMTGAAYLSTMAALRSGAGLTITCAPASLNAIYEEKITEGMTLLCEDQNRGHFSKDNYDVIMDHVEWCDVMVIGPGLGAYDDVVILIEKLVKNINKPMVIDADGLRLFYNNLTLFQEINPNIVITPHLGELSNLIGIKPEELRNDLIGEVDKFMTFYSGVLMAKFSPSLVAYNSKGYVNSTGNPGLATAGSGDILTGIIASLIAQGYTLEDSTIIAMFIHGKAGDQLARSISQHGMIASDLLYKIGRLFSDYEL